MNTHGIAGASGRCPVSHGRGTLEEFSEERIASRGAFLQGTERLSEIHFLWGSGGGLRVPVISLNLREEDSGEVSDWLFHEYGICTRPGGHCAPLMHEFFHTERQGMVRFSFSHGNTEEEVRRAAAALREMTEQ